MTFFYFGHGVSHARQVFLRLSDVSLCFLVIRINARFVVGDFFCKRGVAIVCLLGLLKCFGGLHFSLLKCFGSLCFNPVCGACSLDRLVICGLSVCSGLSDVSLCFFIVRINTHFVVGYLFSKRCVAIVCLLGLLECFIGLCLGSVCSTGSLDCLVICSLSISFGLHHVSFGLIYYFLHVMQFGG